jgi:hypothetical protein
MVMIPFKNMIFFDAEQNAGPDLRKETIGNDSGNGNCDLSYITSIKPRSGKHLMPE